MRQESRHAGGIKRGVFARRGGQISTMKMPPKEGFPVRARTLALCLLLMGANIFWITVIEVRWYSLDVTSLPLFITPIFCLMVAVGVNRWVSRVRPAWALRPAELVLLYIAMVTGAVFAGHDMLQNLFGAIGHAQWRSQVETGWRERFSESVYWK